MPAILDELMETASRALAEMDYARCEALCVEALGQARDTADWVMYQRVLLPLQEARRQRRQAALDGPILLGAPDKQINLADAIAQLKQGCVVLTHPFHAEDAKSLSETVRDLKQPIELLFADNASDAQAWQITTITGPKLSTTLRAPKPEWIGQWIEPAKVAPPTPAHWFMQASEALGDTAIDAIDATPGSLAYLQALEQALSCVDDHEILHQRLADAARALHEAER